MIIIDYQHIVKQADAKKAFDSNNTTLHFKQVIFFFF